jgi:hypothetical protein
MMVAKLLRAMKFVIIVRLGLGTVRTSLFLSLCCFPWSPTEAQAQLWETPPLPVINYAPTPDGYDCFGGE